MWCVMEEWGMAGGVEAWLKIQDQKQWDGHGSPSGAVEKSGIPYHQHCSDWFTNRFDYVMCLCMCVCVHVHRVPGRVAFRLKASPVEIRWINQSINQSINPQQLHNKCVSKHYCHCIRVLRIGYLPLTADVPTEGGRPYRTVRMIATSAAINLKCNGTVVT